MELRLVQVRVEAAALQQLAVRAELHDASAVHDQDQVRGQDGAEAVGDDDAAAIQVCQIRTSPAGKVSIPHLMCLLDCLRAVEEACSSRKALS